MKSSPSEESATSTNSNSLLTRLNSLSSWLALPETQRQLQVLREEEAATDKAIRKRLPGDTNPANYMYDLTAREQAIGYGNGLARLQELIDTELEELKLRCEQEKLL